MTEGGAEAVPDFAGGLIPAIAQDFDTGDVLMVAYMDREAWERTVATGRAWFHSRRRGLWEKGATSGHHLEVIERWVDCDADTVLLKVRPAGPVCHTGQRTCFYRRG